MLSPTPQALHPVVSGIPGTEGPCVTKDGRVFVVAPGEGRIVEVWLDGRQRDFARTRGVPAGLQLDRDGDLLVADMARGILRVTPDGRVHDLVSAFEGRPIRGCNDLAFDTRGNLYFTAPAGSSDQNPCGELFCLLADGELRRLDAGFAFCNGLAVSADDRTLVVAETLTKRLFAYDLSAPGVAGPRRLFATLGGDHQGGGDGMDFDAEGRLVVAHWGGSRLEIFAPDGRRERVVPLPFSRPSNVHFLGPGSHQLLITEHDTHGLWLHDYGAPGQTQYGWL